MAVPIVIGRGKLYIDGRAIGNCKKVFYRPEKTFLKKMSYASGVRTVVAAVTSEYTLTGGFVTDHITKANLDLFLSQDATLHVVEFRANNGRGSNGIYTFSDCLIKPEGDHTLVGNEWQEFGFSFEATGLIEVVLGGTWSATTTTSTTSTTSSTTT
jgi:hypothetical protein